MFSEPSLPRRFAIVGHARSPEGRGWGPLLDACGGVLRMWDSGWQNAADYGTRYDIGFLEIGHGLVEKAMRHRKRDPNRGWLASWLHGSSPRLPKMTEVVDQREWTAVGRRFGGVGTTGRLEFTRGTVAACWAISRAEPGDEIVLVGFDNIRRGVTLDIDKAFCPEYRAHPGSFSFNGYKGGETKFGNHDYTVERPVMEFLAAERGVILSFAQDVWN